MHPLPQFSRLSLGLSLGLLAAMALAQPASAFTAINHHRVNPVAGTAQFEVIGRPGSGPLEYWCAAAEYARLELGQPTRAQVMMVSPRGPSVTSGYRSAVVFQLDPAGTAPPSPGAGYSLKQAGYGMTIGTAGTFCDNLLGEREWVD